MAFKKQLLKDVLPISSNIGLFHDAWLGILAEYYGYQIIFLRKTLIDFIRHENNASSSARRQLRLVLGDRLRFVLALLFHVIRKSTHHP
jgi:hypothetical protein